MKKHAYLIMAHNHLHQLQTLLNLIDDERNDVYLHVDRKWKDFSPASLHMRHSSLTLIDRMSIAWGGDSMVWCELDLLKAAAPNHYAYYHLLSGYDLPLKTQDEIHTFFDKNGGRDYIGFDERANESKSFINRVQYYHFLRNFVGRPVTFLQRCLGFLERKFLRAQEILHVSRKALFPLYKGDQWFSITDDLVHFILAHSKIIKRQLCLSSCADELLVQSMVMHPDYKGTVVKNCLRAIDWERGTPYTYLSEDVPSLLASPKLWGRKFNDDIDAEAISLVEAHLRLQTHT